MSALPIRLRFAAWAAGLVTFALVLYSAVTLLNLYHEQLEAVDLDLIADGRRLAAMSTTAEVLTAVTETEHFAPWVVYAIFDENGNLRYRSTRLPEPLAREALTQAHRHTASDSRERWRIGMFSGPAATVVVAYNLHEVRDILQDLILAYALSLPVVAIIAAAGGWWISGRALRPIRDLAATVERVQAESLDHRVPIPPARDDLQRLSLVFNAMLGRLEASFEQAQRFAADASHELRTPLTIIRGEIERLMHARGIQAEHQEKLVSVQEEIERLQHITDNLLLLARLDSGHTTIGSTPVDLSELVREACDDAELLAAASDVRIERDIADTQLVRGEAGHLRRAILNLLDNAVKFNVPGGRVRCTLRAVGDGVDLEIDNTGGGIRDDVKPQLFQRFFRANSNRESFRRGHGLGLSLSREIARAHGGELVLADPPSPEWTRFVFSLPSISAELKS